MKREQIFLVTTVALLIVAVVLYLDLQESREGEYRKDSVIAEKNAQIEYSKNKLNQIISSKPVAIVTPEEIQKAYPEIVKAIEKKMESKFKDMRVYIQNEFQARGSGEATVNNYYHTDSTGRRSEDSLTLNSDDKFLQYQVTYYGPGKPSKYEYLYSDKASTGFFSNYRWYKPWKKEVITAKTVFDNPNAKVTNTTNILTNEYKDRRWVIVIGGYYDPFRKEAGVSISGGYALFKF